jgi:LUD domain
VGSFYTRRLLQRPVVVNGCFGPAFQSLGQEIVHGVFDGVLRIRRDAGLHIGYGFAERREMRTLAASPNYVVGSVHALTEGRSLLIASASGSQLGPLVSGAGQVILVIGAQKIVPDLATGMRRIYEYCYPLEDARARRAYGVPSGVNNILIINKAVTPGRVTAIIVNERLGF